MLGTLVVSLSLMTVCFPDQTCHPVLLGAHTKAGTYPLTHARTLAAGYGANGEVLAFAMRSDNVPLAVHRVYRMDPRRIAVLNGPASLRSSVTGGCINVMPDVFQKALDCCRKGQITIAP